MLALKKEEASSGGGLIIPTPTKTVPVNKYNLEMAFGSGQDQGSSPRRDTEGAHQELGLKVRRFNSIWLIE